LRHGIRKPIACAELGELLGERSIILVGMMGAGKSAIGRRLALGLERPFIDADATIEEAAQMSISEIFSAFGEEQFRKYERRVIARILESRAQVVALGGGAYLNPETKARVKAAGLAIWLDAAPEVILERVRHREHRPLLDRGALRETIHACLEARIAAYSDADLRVVSDAVHPNEMVDRVLAAVIIHLKH
jgi:shikimate kinase